MTAIRMTFVYFNSMVHRLFRGGIGFLKFGVMGLFLVLGGAFASSSEARDLHGLKTDHAEILFPENLQKAAQETAGMVPEITRDLRNIFGWSVTLKPTIILVEDSKRFQAMAGSPLVTGFAVPGRNVVVIDCSRISRPFEFQNILKHELCHLYIHKHLGPFGLPRWLDEGIAQWVSKGAMDIIENPKGALLPKAAFSDSMLPLGALANGFPRTPDALRLAYEESKSFIDYLIRVYGRDKLLQILNRMEQGLSLRQAFSETYGVPFYKVEEEWQSSLIKNIAWIAYLSRYLYEILFALGGLLVIYAFIRMMKKKRAYMDEP